MDTIYVKPSFYLCSPGKEVGRKSTDAEIKEWLEWALKLPTEEAIERGISPAFLKWVQDYLNGNYYPFT